MLRGRRRWRPDRRERVDVDGHRLCVVRIGDDWYVINDECSHADYSLSEGDVWEDEREIECPKHGSTFSLETGEPQTLPATQPVPVVQGAGRRRRRARLSLDGGLVSELVIRDLHASVDGFEILRGVDLEVRSGEVHAVMGPNGSGKSTLSHVILGRGDYEVTGGSVTLDGEELLELPTWQRAARGLFLAMQYPVAVPGVPVRELVAAAALARGEDPAELAARVDDRSRSARRAATSSSPGV